MNDKYIRKIIYEANQLYRKYDLDKNIITVALDIAVRYIKKAIPSEPREKNVLYCSAYFIAIRHPFSYPSQITRDGFADQFNIKTTSLDWYINRILTDLSFIRIHDLQTIPYFIDPTSLIFTVTTSIIHSNLSESLINAVLTQKIPDVNILVDKILGVLIDRLKILPNVFKRSLRGLVLETIRGGIKDLRL
ncbi:MAG: hypothetical protein ACFFCM_14965 [Promethearchaeota archaeon]